MCIYLIPQHGLCNRLSWICGFYSYCRAMSHRCPNKECICYIKWTPARACNGHFLEIFKAFTHSKFVNNDREVPIGIKRYSGQHSVPNVYSKILKIDIENKDIVSGIYNISDDESISTNEIIRLIANSRGESPIIWKLNKSILIFLAKIGSLLNLPALNPKLNQEQQGV